MTELYDEINELIGPPVSVDSELLTACLERNEFGGLSFDLYREATKLVWVTCNTYYPDAGEEICLTRNQAICAGLLSRISKIMLSVVKLSSDLEHGETVQILDRCVLESSIDLQYLLAKNEDSVYERFVRTGLRSERNLYDIIQANIQDRDGQELEIEQSMLLSIRKTCADSGVKIEEIEPNAGSWGGSYRDRLEAIGLGDAYPIFQGMTSQAVHGSWSDLIRNYLQKNENGYQPNSEHTQTDGKLLGPMALFATNAAKAYTEKFFDPRDAEPIVRRLEDFQQRLSIVETSRPGWELVPRTNIIS